MGNVALPLAWRGSRGSASGCVGVPIRSPAGPTSHCVNAYLALAAEPSGYVLCLGFDEATLALGPFLWFGGRPGEPLPAMSGFRTTRHTKANAQGVKAERPNIRVVPKTNFEALGSVGEVAERLFGPRPTAVANI